MGSVYGSLTHLRDLNNIGLLDEPGRLIVGISHQYHDLFCHLRRGKGSWASSETSVIKGQWPLMPLVYVSVHPSSFLPSLIHSCNKYYSATIWCQALYSILETEDTV